MLQCFAQFCVAFLQFLKQPHVLDSDNGLVGEGLEKSYLLLGEGADFFRSIAIAPIKLVSFSNGTAKTLRIPSWR